MNNKQELIKAHEEIIKNMSVQELVNYCKENEIGELYERVLFSMPKKAEMESFRVALIVAILGSIDFNDLTEEQLQELLQYMTTKKEN
jgi:hypothetical protein